MISFSVLCAYILHVYFLTIWAPTWLVVYQPINNSSTDISLGHILIDTFVKSFTQHSEYVDQHISSQHSNYYNRHTCIIARTNIICSTLHLKKNTTWSNYKVTCTCSFSSYLILLFFQQVKCHGHITAKVIIFLCNV